MGGQFNVFFFGGGGFAFLLVVINGERERERVENKILSTSPF